MTTPFNSTVELIPAEKVNGETVIPFTPSPQRVELELTLARLSEDNADNSGTDYTEDLVTVLNWGKDKAADQGQTYMTKRNHYGFSWGTKLGKYTCTKNAEENKLYVNFKTWADLRKF